MSCRTEEKEDDVVEEDQNAKRGITYQVKRYNYFHDDTQN